MRNDTDGGDDATPGDLVEVESWNDIDSVPSRVTDEQKDLVKAELNRSEKGTQIVWFPEFIHPHSKGLDPIHSGSHLVRCDVADWSDDAWMVEQDGEEPCEFVPKDWSIVFVKATDAEIENEQTTLASAW